MKPKKKRKFSAMTLEQFEEQLKASGEYDTMMERRGKQEAERQAQEAEWRRAQAPLIADLKRVGLNVESAWDLVNTEAPYPEALPILLEHLQRPYPQRVREGIARALAVPEAVFAFDALADLYEREPSDSDGKRGLAVAVALTATDSSLGRVIELARDRIHGSSRVLLLMALKKSRSPHVLDALSELSGDQDLTKEAQAILRRRKPRK